MLAFLLLGVTVALIAVQVLSLKDPLKNVGLVYDTDLKLAEPGETIKLRYTVFNKGRRPVQYVGVSFSFDGQMQVISTSTGKAERSFTGINCSASYFIMPGQSAKCTIEFTLQKRGIHKIGLHYVEAGDFLGLRTVVKSFEPRTAVICTSRLSEQDIKVVVKGGYIGDITTRRFIMDDPSIIAGYREYTANEPMKKISWLQTAKQGKLMVKINDYTIDVNVTVALNMENYLSSGSQIEKCFELARSVCEELEDQKIPYMLITNGDMGILERGLGRLHLLTVLRRIGNSGCACYSGFGSLVDKCIANRSGNTGYIVITMPLPPDGIASLARLQSSSDREVLVLNPQKQGG